MIFTTHTVEVNSPSISGGFYEKGD